jgi:hypothetical protein
VGPILTQPKYAVEVWLITPDTKTDSYGNPALDWNNTTETPLPGAQVLIPATRSGARSSSADDTNLSTSVEGGAIFIMTGPPIPPMTLIDVDTRLRDSEGRVWRVSGNPNIKQGLHYQSTHLTSPLHFLRREAPRA